MFEELFKALRADKFPEHEKHWDNMALDYVALGSVVPDVATAADCNALCVNDEGCFQSKFDGWECTVLNNAFVIGKQKSPNDSKMWESFWNTSRISKWVDSQEPCPSKPKYPHEDESYKA